MQRYLILKLYEKKLSGVLILCENMNYFVVLEHNLINNTNKQASRPFSCTYFWFIFVHFALYVFSL